MIVYVTCTKCLKVGKPFYPTDYYSKGDKVASLKCPHCGKFINQDETQALTKL